MSKKLQILSVSDLMKVMQLLEHEPDKKQRVEELLILELGKSLYLNEENGDFLLRIPPKLKHESQFQYFFFTENHVFEVHHVGIFTPNFSFRKFPEASLAQKPRVQERLREILILSGCYSGWREGSWDELNEAQKAEYYPLFIQDDQTGLS